MRRRRFVVGTACGLATALAGCLGPSQDSLSQRPPENEVEDSIRTAVGEANTVAVELAGVREDGVQPGSLDLDWAALRDRVETANAELDTAEGHEAADPYEDDVATARAYVGVVDDLLSATSDLDDVGGQLDALETALEEGDYDSAGDELDALGPEIETVVSTTDGAASAIQAVDADRLSTYGARTDDLTEGVDSLDGLARAANSLIGGYDEVLAGRERMENGRNEFEARDYAAAETEFQAASDRFADATSTFEGGQSETEQLVAEFETAICRSGHLEDAATHFAAAASAAGSGDLVSAQNEYQEGDDALDDVAAC